MVIGFALFEWLDNVSSVVSILARLQAQQPSSVHRYVLKINLHIIVIAFIPTKIHRARSGIQCAWPPDSA